MSDEVLSLAYDSALNALREQDSTISNLRNRANGLLAASVLGTSFAAALGLLNTNPSQGPLLPPWAEWALMVIVTLIGANVMVVLWPASRWSFGPDPAQFLANAGKDLDEVRRVVTTALIHGIAANDRSVTIRMRAYRISAGLLLAESMVLVLALLTD